MHWLSELDALVAAPELHIERRRADERLNTSACRRNRLRADLARR